MAKKRKRKKRETITMIPYQKTEELFTDRKSMLILIFLLVLLLPSVMSAPAINFSYEGDENVSFTNVTATIYKPSTGNITVNNIGNYSITNLTCYPLNMFNCSYSNIIIPGETTTYSFEVLTEQVFDNTIFVLNTNFLYLTPFEVEKTNHTILVNDYGINQSPYNPNNLTVLLNDTIFWQNNDNVTHTITVLSGTNTFDISINPGQNYVYSPQNIEVIEYYDRTTGKNAYLNVMNNTAFYSTHNAEYDKSFNVNLKSGFALTQLSTEIYTKEFSINYNDQLNGVFKLTNNMEETAYNIRLSLTTPYVSSSEFVPQNKSIPFNLETNESVIVLFKNSPLITSTGETGKTYNASISVSADNTLEIIEQIIINIRFKDIMNETGCNVDWEGRRLYCRENPTSVYCLTEALEKNITIIEYVPLLYYTNFSESEVRDAFLDRPTCEQILTRLTNRFDSVSFSVQNNTDRMNDVNEIISVANNKMFDELRNETISLKKDLKFTKTFYPFVFAMIIVVSVLTFFIVKAVRNRGSD